MTKGEYCRLKRIHFCKPKFNPKSEADEEFMKDIDEIIGIVNNRENTDECVERISGNGES